MKRKPKIKHVIEKEESWVGAVIMTGFVGIFVFAFNLFLFFLMTQSPVQFSESFAEKAFFFTVTNFFPWYFVGKIGLWTEPDINEKVVHEVDE